jgi:flagellar hook-associated protein 2
MTSPLISTSGGTSSISGLVSGMDTASIVSQLMQIESQPKTMLQNRLATAQTDASAYRDINVSFAALATAAQKLTTSATWATAKASSSDPTVTATASSGATPGSLSFTVTQVAAAHQVQAKSTWTNLTDAYGLGSTLTIKSANGAQTFGTIAITSSGGGPASLNDAVNAINKSGLGLSATTIGVNGGYALQVTATATGAAKAFLITSDTDAAGSSYAAVRTGQDAAISFPNASGGSYTSTSATNTFSNVLPNVSFTVGQVTPPGGTAATITVGTDPDAITSSMKAVVDAANAVLTKITKYTDSSTGSTAALKGDFSVISLKNQILSLVSSSVATNVNGVAGTSSAGSNGVQLTKDGALTFDATAFKTALAAKPSVVQQIFGGAVGKGADGVANTVDDTLVTDGVGARLQILANGACDSVSGMLVSLANGQDTVVKDLQSQIDGWTSRLQMRQKTLTAQFTAMETALGTLKSQSSWLTSQINSLPSWSSTSKSN